MKIITTGTVSTTPDTPWWHGLHLTCPHCGTVVELDGTERMIGHVRQLARAIAHIPWDEDEIGIRYDDDGRPLDMAMTCPHCGEWRKWCIDRDELRARNR